MIFSTAQESHNHSLTILNALQEYDEFMESIGSVVDLGCGDGLDLEWWATRETREEVPKPLNISCMGVDIRLDCPMAKKYQNITYHRQDFEEPIVTIKNEKFDILWAQDSFQYCTNPLTTLAKWRDISNDSAMLCVTVAQTTNLTQNKLSFHQQSGVYYHYTLVNLIHMLAVNGWDCNTGYFLKVQNSPWITAVVYKSEQEPMDPKTTSWFDLAEKKLVPETLVKSLNAHGYVRQEDLILPWLDHSLIWMNKQ